MWLSSLFHELGITSAIPTVWIDNLSTIALASNSILHAITNHIELDFHFVREKIVVQSLQVLHVRSIDQVTDFFTKLLSLQFFIQLINKLKIVSFASLELKRAISVSSSDMKLDKHSDK